ncbi:FxLYD domain-containing protein [Streptomyces sp. NPDC097610]|uniref:FxLYD domain-containing protein n=1 Tax=Streptomyces sp. NPDC097610 TaxID=3157227 RepID=UPI00331FB2FE
MRGTGGMYGVRGIRAPGVRRTGPGAVAVVLLLALGACLAGCSHGTSPSDVASAASSLASQAGDSLASATAEAGRKFDEFRNGLNAKDEVKLGDRVSIDSAGRATVKATATNPTSAAKTYAVQVDFRDKGGNLLDTVVVTLNDVPAGAAKDAAARSHRTLSGDVTADVARAVRT